jgi:hypothetical protein
MKISLRAKILLFTVPPLIALAVAAIWIVNRTISSEVHRNIEDELKRASTLFEELLATRSEHLAVNGMVIVQDPRFFSVLTLPGSPRDPEFRATVAGVANAFNSITETDLFEVFDSRGRSITSMGHEQWDQQALAPFIASALSGAQRVGLLAGSEHNYQVAATPVLAGGGWSACSLGTRSAAVGGGATWAVTLCWRRSCERAGSAGAGVPGPGVSDLGCGLECSAGQARLPSP